MTKPTGLKQINATEFKAKCLDLLDQLSTGHLEEIEVTKRGAVVARVVPARGKPISFAEWQDSMKGSVHIPERFDLTPPACDDVSEADLGFFPC